jgi:hypothetical protein
MRLPKTKSQPRRLRKDDPNQSAAFIQKAREVGADQESCADELLGRLARTPPQPHIKHAGKRQGKAKSGR